MSMLTTNYRGHKVQAQHSQYGWASVLDGEILADGFPNSARALNDSIQAAQYDAMTDEEWDAIERARKRLAEVKAIENELDAWEMNQRY